MRLDGLIVREVAHAEPLLGPILVELKFHAVDIVVMKEQHIGEATVAEEAAIARHINGQACAVLGGIRGKHPDVAQRVARDT